MYSAELQFRIIGDTSYAAAETAIRVYLEALIFQGQILGREFPTAFQQEQFVSRVVLPEKMRCKPNIIANRATRRCKHCSRLGCHTPKY